MKLYNKKAAMFGLDARIALAIFGALSVITGAALYSAIGNAKVTAIVVSFNEIAKANEQYTLDVGQDLDKGGVVPLSVADLLETNGYSGWKGPYLNARKTSDTNLAYAFSGVEQPVGILKCNSSFGNEYSTTGCNACASKDDCNIYLLTLGDVFTQELAKKLDAKIDDSDGYDKGKLRVQWADATKSDNLRVLYYIMPALSI